MSYTRRGHSHDSASPPSSEEEVHGQYPANSPTTPHTSSVESPLLQPNTPMARSMSSGYISSPLNPNGPARSPPHSSAGTPFQRMASDETQALGSGQRGSMLLYRLASDDDLFKPPHNRFSGTESIFSLDSKYPTTSRGMMIPYVYDPELDDKEVDQDDFLNVPDEPPCSFSWRGVANLGLLISLILALLTLFVFYPVWYFVNHNDINLAIDGNLRINGTGQAGVFFQMPELIDKDTPDSAKSRTGFDNQEYTLVFSDEFNTEGRTFYPGDDPYWEAVDIWYGATEDLEWYDPRQVTTRGGNLVILLEEVANHNLQFRSGMLQSWNKFCFTNGYIEVNLTLPGRNNEARGYWPGAWTMGNLGRPGYGASTDGTWPYTYDSCDVGTYPNQTWSNHSGPAAALFSPASRVQYNNELSWLTGQKLSACTCEGEDHPGPSVNRGRGAPEIDILEAEKNKYGDGQVVSQSAQFAPFAANYVYQNSTQDEFDISNPLTFPNPYVGSAVQQAISSLTELPTNMFNGSGAAFGTFGFEYWSNADHRDEGYITWQANGVQTYRMGAGAVGPDQGPDGSGVSQRLIPEEPMSIILNLGISNSFQQIDFTSLDFPAELLIDYIRVYQRSNEPQNIGCDPSDYPTMDYINRHLPAYTNPSLTRWTTAPDGSGYNQSFPRNGQYEGGC